MRARGPCHGSRLPALSGGAVAVAALALFAFPPPARAGSTTEPRERPSVPSVSGGSPAVPEQALHRVHAATAGAAARLAHPGGYLPILAPPITPVPRDGRPDDSVGVAPPTSGPPLRVLFCTWLN
jgi:hypothetical protein